MHLKDFQNSIKLIFFCILEASPCYPLKVFKINLKFVVNLSSLILSNFTSTSKFRNYHYKKY